MQGTLRRADDRHVLLLEWQAPDHNFLYRRDLHLETARERDQAPEQASYEREWNSGTGTPTGPDRRGRERGHPQKVESTPQVGAVGVNCQEQLGTIEAHATRAKAEGREDRSG